MGITPPPAPRSSAIQNRDRRPRAPPLGRPRLRRFALQPRHQLVEHAPDRGVERRDRGRRVLRRERRSCSNVRRASSARLPRSASSTETRSARRPAAGRCRGRCRGSSPRARDRRACPRSSRRCRRTRCARSEPLEQQHVEPLPRTLGPRGELIVGARAGVRREHDLLRIVERRGGRRRDEQRPRQDLRRGRAPARRPARRRTWWAPRRRRRATRSRTRPRTRRAPRSGATPPRRSPEPLAGPELPLARARTATSGDCALDRPSAPGSRRSRGSRARWRRAPACSPRSPSRAAARRRRTRARPARACAMTSRSVASSWPTAGVAAPWSCAPARRRRGSRLPTSAAVRVSAIVRSSMLVHPRVHRRGDVAHARERLGERHPVLDRQHLVEVVERDRAGLRNPVRRVGDLVQVRLAFGDDRKLLARPGRR